MLTEQETAALCAAGAMAPSGGNAQPWRVRVSADRLRVRAEPDGSFLDVGGFAARFAVGCFAENVAVTAQSLGLEHELSTSDDGAEFRFTGRGAPQPHHLGDCVAERVTNRLPSDGATLAEPVLASILDAVPDLAGGLGGARPDFPGAPGDDGGRAAAGRLRVAVAAAGAKPTVAKALGAADVLRLRHPVMFADMMREISWTDRETAQRREGLDLKTLELPGATAKLLSLLRRFPAVRKLLPSGPLADTARQVVANSSHMCCLSAAAPLTGEAMVVAGMAMQRLWLSATRHGVWVHPWTVGTLLLMRLEGFGANGLTGRESEAVARIGRDLRAGFGLGPHDHPVFVFRLFTGPPPRARSLRRPWRSFVEGDESAD